MAFKSLIFINFDSNSPTIILAILNGVLPSLDNCLIISSFFILIFLLGKTISASFLTILIPSVISRVARFSL